VSSATRAANAVIVKKAKALAPVGKTGKLKKQIRGTVKMQAASGIVSGTVRSGATKAQRGKGVATAAGVLLAINPLLGAATLGSWLIVAVFTRYSSLAAIVAALFAPFYQLLIWGPSLMVLPIAIMSLLLVWRHEANIRKLMAGTESRIGQKAAGAAPDGPAAPPDSHTHAQRKGNTE
jgi:acyl-phosphate glycerol 3-phosphate acyltransferase